MSSGRILPFFVTFFLTFLDIEVSRLQIHSKKHYPAFVMVATKLYVAEVKEEEAPAEPAKKTTRKGKK